MTNNQAEEAVTMTSDQIGVEITHGKAKMARINKQTVSGDRARYKYQLVKGQGTLWARVSPLTQHIQSSLSKREEVPLPQREDLLASVTGPTDNRVSQCNALSAGNNIIQCSLMLLLGTPPLACVRGGKILCQE